MRGVSLSLEQSVWAATTNIASFLFVRTHDVNVCITFIERSRLYRIPGVVTIFVTVSIFDHVRGSF
jgi:hypothetical protein